MAVNTRRGLISALAIAGVDVAQRAPPVSDTIQLTYQMGDLSNLIPPIAQPTFVSTVASGLNVARFGVIELSAPPDSAIVIPWFRNDQVALTLFWRIGPATIITDDLLTPVPQVSVGGEPARALLQTGTGATGGFIALQGLAELASNFPPVVLPPGSIMQWVTMDPNEQVFLSLVWLEIPIAAPSTPA